MSDWHHADGRQPADLQWNGTEWEPVPRPGVIPLRPLGVSSILGGSLRTMRRYPWQMLGVSAAISVVLVGAQTYLMYRSVHGWAFDVDSTRSGTVELGSDIPHYQLIQAAESIASILAATLLAGVLTATYGPAVLGQRASVGDVFREVRARFWRLLGTTLATAAITVVAAVCLLIPGAVMLAVATDESGLYYVGIAALVLGGIGTVVVTAYLFVSLSFATSVVMLEKRSPIDALRRSRELVRGDWWRVFGILLLAVLIGSGVVLAFTAPVYFVTFRHILDDPYTPVRFPTSLIVWLGVATFVGRTVVQPFHAGVAVLLYVDRRMRREGLHLTLQQMAAPQPDAGPDLPQ